MRGIRRLIGGYRGRDLGEFAPAPFVFGAARSGTTLLRLMLDSHPQLAIPPETHFIPHVARKEPSSPSAFLSVVTGSPRWGDWHLDEEELRGSLEALDPFTNGEALRVFYRAYAARFGKPRWGDKTPAYATHLLLIEELLPEAAFVHLIRDPRDVVASVLSADVPWWGTGGAREAAERWRDRVGTARHQGSRCRHYLEARFEELIHHPEQTLRRMCGFVGLPWDPEMLAYTERATDRLSELGSLPYPGGKRMAPGSERRALHSLTTQPPLASRIGTWEKRLSATDVRDIEKVAGDLMTEFGYEPQGA